MKKTDILLLGCGHANIQVLHGLGKMKNSDLKVTVVSDVVYAPYSGMIPSFLAGVYSSKMLEFDIEKICKQYNFTLLKAKANIIQAKQNKVHLSTGETISYDICSVNIGIESTQIPMLAVDNKNIIYLKPISQFIEQWNQIKQFDQNQNLDIKIIGGGAAAFEIAIACRRHFKGAQTKISIITGQHHLLYGENSEVKKHALDSLKKSHIELIEQTRVEKIDADFLYLSNGQRLHRQICFVGTSAAANPIFKKSELPTNESGFVCVSENLLVKEQQNIFAAGDCCHFTSQPLKKAGVFAVRQGPVVLHNILALINQKKMKHYSPQKDFLKILVSGNNEAIAVFHNFCLKNRLAWKLKNYIDLKFMRRFQ